MSLAGGLSKGDRVILKGAPASVIGPPSRPAAAKISVAVRCDDGRVLDVRVAELDKSAGAGGYSTSAQIPTPYGQGNRILEDRHAKQPLGGEVEAGYGLGNRSLNDSRPPQPQGYESADAYGIGNRILDNRHAAQPIGGEIEAGWGIGNRILEAPNGNGIAPRTELDDASLEALKILSLLDEKMAQLEDAVQYCETIGALAQLEGYAKQLESDVDSVQTNHLVAAKQQVKEQKHDLVTRFHELFTFIDRTFQSAGPAAAPSTPVPWSHPPAAGPPQSALDRPPSQAGASMVSRPPSAAPSVTPNGTSSRPRSGQPLAGGLYRDDRVMHKGVLGTVMGKPARAALSNISVSVRLDNGSMVDARVNEIELQIE